MYVFVAPTGRRIQPFDDPIGETLIHNRPLSQWQAEAFAAAKLQVIRERKPPCLVVPDNIFTTGAALARFSRDAAGRNAVLVLKRSQFGEQVTRVQPNITEVAEGWRIDDIRFDNGSEVAPAEILLDPEEKVVEVPFPRAFIGENTLQIGIPRLPVAILHHWVHILWANQLAGGVGLLNASKLQLGIHALWVVIRARSVNKWRGLAKATRIGRNCDIHPTAVVEGSTIGDNVTIGPFAHVQFSTLGNGAVVMPAAQVSLSVLGEEAVVSEQCVIRYSVLYPGAIASQRLMQQCVLGRDVVTTAGAGTIDFNFDGDVKVPLDGKLYSTGSRFMGSAFGHRARIGTGFYLTCGRSIPNDYFLIRDPRQVLSQIPPGLEGTALVASTYRATPLQLLARRPRSKR